MQYHVQHYILKPVTRQKLEQLEDILTELYKSKEASHQKILALSESNYQKELFDALRLTISAALKFFSVLRFTITA